MRKKPIKCITLTFSEWDEKYCDRTIILKDNKWLFYNDDLTFSGPHYETIEDLLETIEDVLNRPLYHD